MTARYALYYTPAPGSPLAELGADWLGRDVVSGEARPQPAVDGLDIAAVTASPRLYGFHATLKAPFTLRDGTTEADLLAAAAGYAKSRPPVEAPPLTLARLNGFTALVLADPGPALNGRAADIVEAFDGFRRPLTAEERARRRPERLTPRQQELLDLWGYPFVMETFVFHMTLSGPVDDPTAELLLSALAPRVAPIVGRPWTLDALTVMRQPAPGKPFRVIARQPFGGASAAPAG